MSRSMKKTESFPGLGQLYSRPGFLLRRANQIAMNIATRGSARIGLTPPQHSCLIALNSCPGLDQISLGKALGIDRATIGQVLRRLEARGLVRRENVEDDARRKTVSLTVAGRRLIGPAVQVTQDTGDRILSVLSPAERKVFVMLLEKIVTELNDESPTPLVSPEDRSSREI